MSSSLADAFALAANDPLLSAPALPDPDSLVGLALAGLVLLAGALAAIARGGHRPPTSAASHGSAGLYFRTIAT